MVTHLIAAFAAPRWDAQLAQPVEIEYERTSYFVDNTPVVRITPQDEWIRLELSSGVNTFILAEDFKSLTSAEDATIGKKPL